MEYSSVTAIVLLTIVAFCSFALHQSRADASTPMLAGILSITTTALAAGLAWRQTNPWVVLGLTGGAFVILVVASIVSERNAQNARIMAVRSSSMVDEEYVTPMVMPIED